MCVCDRSVAVALLRAELAVLESVMPPTAVETAFELLCAPVIEHICARAKECYGVPSSIVASRRIQPGRATATGARAAADSLFICLDLFESTLRYVHSEV